ncbi:ribbon-helix-helix protein, CopG family [Leptolyngbya sp. GB1-A1]|uniref:ribbon-helix-helix protein, CopG family n=1 Tax=Leptolyngbya sp. GB1-A1 TaxID=2933908 RepID=UPI00329879D8
MSSSKRSKSRKTVRQPHQKKPSSKKKSLRGKPELYDELKKPTTVALTATATAGLDQLAAEMGISRSEFVERIGRRILEVAAQNSSA